MYIHTHVCVFAVYMNYPELLILPFICIWKRMSLHFIYTTYLLRLHHRGKNVRRLNPCLTSSYLNISTGLFLLLLLPPCCPLPPYPCLLTVSALALSTTPVPSSLLISSPSPSPLLFSHIFLSAHLFLLIPLFFFSLITPLSPPTPLPYRLTPLSLPPTSIFIFIYDIFILLLL